MTAFIVDKSASKVLDIPCERVEVWKYLIALTLAGGVKRYFSQGEYRFVGSSY